MKEPYDWRTGGAGPAQNARAGCIHLSFRSGSRAGGASGGASFDYVTRNDTYDRDDLDPAVYTESGHMPSWAEEDPRVYWETADDYERANGRIFVSADFALPVGLDRDAQIALAREFVAELTGKERLPYTLAVHAGLDANGQEHNPHAHLLFSERGNDGIERSREHWFSRANSADPERGGAPKSRAFHGAEWVERARERWAELTNQALEAAGRSERVDHRSYERQGIEKEPGQHYGPAAAYMLGRDGSHDRLSEAAAVGDDAKAMRDIDKEIERLEWERESIERYGLPEERDYSHSSRGDQSNDRAPER